MLNKVQAAVILHWHNDDEVGFLNDPVDSRGPFTPVLTKSWLQERVNAVTDIETIKTRIFYENRWMRVRKDEISR